MEPFIRISTSPPNVCEDNPQDASYYCDLHEIGDWRNYGIVRGIPEPLGVEIAGSGDAGYRVVTTYGDLEIGILVRVRDDEEGVMYVGIDHRGRACREPAANEALWSVANAATDLPDGHRLARDGDGEDPVTSATLSHD